MRSYASSPDNPAPGDDVFDVVRRLGVLLRMEAVFTTIAGSTANKLASGRVHQLPG